MWYGCVLAPDQTSLVAVLQLQISLSKLCKSACKQEFQMGVLQTAQAPHARSMPQQSSRDNLLKTQAALCLPTAQMLKCSLGSSPTSSNLTVSATRATGTARLCHPCMTSIASYMNGKCASANCMPYMPSVMWRCVTAQTEPENTHMAACLKNTCTYIIINGLPCNSYAMLLVCDMSPQV